ncbi:hypothetical protein OLZ68_002714 [Vibrio vulnificus]|nr:hypothetical protein [Vibrio vulnificus]
MSCVVTNQKTSPAVEAGLAFRYAYDRAKFWKACIWALALILAVVQVSVSIYVFAGNNTPFDPAYLTTGPLLTFVFISTFGKHLVSKWQSLGCTLQRLHDYQTMEIGVKPSQLELPKSLVRELSSKRLKQAPGDQEQLETWWSSTLKDVPYPVGKIIATYSTFAWESELRKRYQGALVLLLIICILMPILVSLALDYTILQSLAFVIGTFTPIIAVILDEWLMNRQSLKIAEQLTQGCYNSWDNILNGKLNNDEMHSATEQHMRYWQNFRQSATPIFEWLYKVSRTHMENNMLVDTKQLISDFNKKNQSEL